METQQISNESLFINKYLNRLLTDTTKKQQHIKDEIKIISDYLQLNNSILFQQQQQQQDTSDTSDTSDTKWITLVYHFSTVFKLVLESNLSKLIIPSIDFINKLIMNDNIKNNQIIIFLKYLLYHCTTISDELTLNEIIKLISTVAELKFNKSKTSLLYTFKIIFIVHLNFKNNQSNSSISSKNLTIRIINKTFTNSFKNQINKQTLQEQLKYSLHLFRMLIDLSITVSDNEEFTNNIKIFSLELILLIVQEYSQEFKVFPNIIFYEIGQGVFNSILECGYSTTSNTIFTLSLKIFQLLIINFRNYLIDQIEQYFTLVLLQQFEQQSHKSIKPQQQQLQQQQVIQLILQIFQNDNQILMDLFINSDCNNSKKDLIIKVISSLSNQLKQIKSPLLPLLLECLISIVKTISKCNYQLTDNDGGIGNDEIIKIIKEKEFKILFDQGIQKFNLDGKKGIKHLISSNIIENTPETIAKFIRQYNQILDKKSIGEYLSRNATVLYHFIQLNNFNGFEIDFSLKYLFSTLLHGPGEASLIHRIMEFFSEKYYNDNIDTCCKFFNDSDSVFTLSYSIIMLNTDLHSYQYKTHMSKERYIHNVKGLNGDKDFDSNYLSSIYDRISMGPMFNISEPTSIFDNYNKIKFKNQFPINDPISISNYGIQFKLPPSLDNTITKTTKTTTTTTGNLNLNFKLGKLLIDQIWSIINISLSTLIKEKDSSKYILKCLKGFKYLIKIFIKFEMINEYNSLVSFLSSLIINEKNKELKQKYLNTIQKLTTKTTLNK